MYLCVNSKGRAYLAGREYSADQYEQFLLHLIDHVGRNGSLPSLRSLARDLRISKTTAKKF